MLPKRPRGRPVGSGKNDSAELQMIAEVLARGGATTPTGAIRAIGITNPSVIRRLRNKHNRSQADDGRQEGLEGRSNPRPSHSPS
jgi:hypothetical protein